ncbi:hypothetical protein EUX98_g5119, partial [Antrodiella citrinella]
MSALAVATVCLQNPQIPKEQPSGYLLFDLTFFVRELETDSAPVTSTGLVRFYNTAVIDVSPTMSLYCMCVFSMAALDKDVVSGLLPNVDLSQYNFMGDINYIVPLPGVDILPCNSPPYFILSGEASQVNEATASWEMRPSFYAMGSKNALLLVKASIPDEGRWAPRRSSNAPPPPKKPVPGEKSVHTAVGRLVDIATNGPENLLSHLRVHVDSVTFHNARSQAPALGRSTSDHTT